MLWFSLMVLNASFNSIAATLWWSGLLVEEIGVTVEKQRPVASRWQNFSHNFVSGTPCHERDSNFSDDIH